ncbi:transferase family hexapeptide repeat protein [Georgenia soli]|uniref:Transferase family hexapeptide repeat protein n=1 Tax=Georgenia soli TaxID=638953 RepID=A0A2A9EL92_9MICO|nr:transferase family hexapeptide repeat protein [Georgenia soli]
MRIVRNFVMRTLKRRSKVQPSAFVHVSSHIAKDLVAEEYVFVGKNCEIGPQVRLGRYTMLASAVSIIGQDHVHSDPNVPIQFSGRPAQSETVIGRDVWIGRNAIIMRGLIIGDGAIVGAGSVVTRNVPAREVWAGVPARKLRDRFMDPADEAAHRAMVAGPILEPRFAQPQT